METVALGGGVGPFRFFGRLDSHTETETNFKYYFHFNYQDDALLASFAVPNTILMAKQTILWHRGPKVQDSHSGRYKAGGENINVFAE